MTRALYLFPHIPKTGGQSVRLHLARHYRRSDMRMMNLGRSEAEAHAKDGVQIDPDVEVVMGHRVTHQLATQCTEREVRLVTMVRDPIDFLVSRFNYVHRDRDMDRSQAVASLPAWLQGFNDNPMSRWLLWHYGGGRPDEIRDLDEAELERRAVEHLTAFWLVGWVEDIERSMAPLFDAVGITEPFSIHINASGRDYAAILRRTPELEAILRPHAAVDTRLYERAISQQPAS